MPTQTRAQSNQTKTAIEVLVGAQTKNMPRPRQGKRLTDQVNLQSGDRWVFERFLTPLHCEGKLCFSLLSRGRLKHKCCENEEFGGLFWKIIIIIIIQKGRKEKVNVLQKPHGCSNISDWTSEQQVS